MTRIISIAIFQLFCFYNFLSAQSSDLKVRNFSPKEIGRPFTNWSCVQDNAGIIYITNSEGLISYDGTTWLSFEDNPFTTAAKDQNGTVYLGGQGDFGYLTSDESGRAQFHSLKMTVENQDFNSIIWSIKTNDLGVYFASKEGTFYWDGEKITFWDNITDIIQPTKNEIVAVNKNKGLIKHSKSGFKDLPNSNSIQNKPLSHGLYYHEKLLLFFSKGGVYYYYNMEGLKPFSKINKILSERIFSVFNSTLTDTYFVALNNVGVVAFDKEWNILDTINTQTGMQNNLPKFISYDIHDNIWVPLQEGVSIINTAFSLKQWDNGSGLEGVITDIMALDQIIYVGTSKGLYFKKIGTKNFKKHPDFNDKIWSIDYTDIDLNNKKIIINENSLIYSIDQSKNKQVVSNKTSTQIYSPKKSELLLNIAINGIYRIDNFNKPVEELIFSFDNQDQVITSIIETLSGELWIGAKQKGVYKLKDYTADSVEVQLYNDKDGLKGIFEPRTALINGKIYVGTQTGIFRYNAASDSFENTNWLNENIMAFDAINDSTAYLAYEDKINQSVVINKIILKNDGSIEIVDKPYKSIITNTVTKFKNYGGYTYIGTSDGLFRYNEKDIKDYNTPFNTLVRKVMSRDSLIFAGTYSTLKPGAKLPSIVKDQPMEYQPTLTYENNEIRFEYAAAYYELPEKTQYSYILEGNDKSWSSWSNEHIKEYNNLSPGTYSFKVKAKNVYDTEGEIANYTFTILAPWYMTTWAYGLFGIGAGLFVWALVLGYSYRVRQHRKKLKLIVADRTFEVLMQKKEIEKQNELLKEQNEEIVLQRDAINEKNQELEMSQEEILSINEKLQELNTMLEKKVEQRTSKIKSTLRQLQQTNAELDTFIYRASHDLKGPISRINGLTSLAKLESTNPNDLKYYELIELVTKDMNKLLAKLTQVHEVIHAELQKQEVDIPSMIAEIRESINFLESGITPKYSFQLQDALQFKTDPSLLKLILTNLMENALIFRKINKDDPHHIVIKTSQDTNQYFLEISDSGIGILPEQLNKVFNMFYRGSDQSKGSGLGLYLVKMAVDKLRGTIKVDSDYSTQTTFTISIPK